MMASNRTRPRNEAPFAKDSAPGAAPEGQGESAGIERGLDARLLQRIIHTLSRPNVSPRRTQRSSLRYAVLAPALVWRADGTEAGEPIRVQLINISSGGIGLLAGSSLDGGVPFAFEMSLEGIGPIQWKCVVRWCLPTPDDTHRIGAHFIETNVSGLNTPSTTATA